MFAFKKYQNAIDLEILLYPKGYSFKHRNNQLSFTKVACCSEKVKLYKGDQKIIIAEKKACILQEDQFLNGNVINASSFFNMKQSL